MSSLDEAESFPLGMRLLLASRSAVETLVEERKRFLIFSAARARPGLPQGGLPGLCSALATAVHHSSEENHRRLTMEV